jgi:hypothetical protein
VTRELSIQDVASIMERVPDLSGMMLVGGQALNYWAETLRIADARSTGIYGPATSEDIDIMGCAPCKGGVFQWVQVPPGKCSSRKLPEQLWR